MQFNVKNVLDLKTIVLNVLIMILEFLLIIMLMIMIINVAVKINTSKMEIILFVGSVVTNVIYVKILLKNVMGVLTALEIQTKIVFVNLDTMMMVLLKIAKVIN